MLFHFSRSAGRKGEIKVIELFSGKCGNATQILHLEPSVLGAGKRENFSFQGLQLE